MGQITTRVNLSARSFPFLSQNWGRSIIVPQYDTTFNRQVYSGEDQDKDVGIPQIFYCHNVMPEQQGFQSVGYTLVQFPANPAVTNFWVQFPISDTGSNQSSIGITANGDFYVSVANTWVFKANYPAAIPGSVSVAHVSGVSYIYISGYGCIKYDFGLGVFVAVVLTSLVPATILGITGAAGYLIAWSSSAVAWSSTIDPTDFTPSLTTGAGSGSVEGARGAITLCLANNVGFIVYTTKNAVAALYSGNSRYPFNFREVVGSGGLSSLFLVSFDSNTGNHYAYTTSGLQLISSTQAVTYLPDLTDFIAGKLFEDYDEGTQTFSSVALSFTMAKAIALVSDRYLVISYGISSFTHALVYDITSKRWGKLKIPHVQCFEYQLPAPGVTEIPRQSIAFLQADGTVKTVNFAVADSSSNGVLCLGKYQFVRARLLELQEVWLENVYQGYPFTIYALAALDGKNNVQSTLNLLDSTGLLRHYGSNAVGINISLVMQGAFSMVSNVIVFNIGGKR